jgi:hypothetical protein
MSWKVSASASNDGGVREKAPAGNHVAVLVALIDLGQQWQDGYQGEEGKYQHRVYFVWELVTKPLQGFKDRNHVLAVDLTLSLNEKAKMRKWLEARRGEKIKDGQFDIADELGKPCLLNVVMNNNNYPKVEGVSQMPEGLPVPPNKHPLTMWKMGEDIAAVPAWVPWLYGRSIQEVIATSTDYRQPGDQAAVASPAPAPQQKKSGPPAPGNRPPVLSWSPHAEFYVHDPEQQEYVRLKGQAIVEMYESGKMSWFETWVYPVSQADNPEPKLAKDYGFPLPKLAPVKDEQIPF